MKKRYIVLISVLLIVSTMITLQYIHNDVKANSDYLAKIQSVDSDGDFLSDQVELELGTNPYSADSDSDFISDLDELYLGTSALKWDTDDDHMADGNEKGVRTGSTSPFEIDSDHDGLEDPWEDNDNDDLLNREEQLAIHDGLCFYTSMFEDAPASTDPNEADSDDDGWNDGLEVQANTTYTGQGAVSPAPVVDRLNPDLDISATSTSWAKSFLSIVGGWDTATFADWETGLKNAGSYGLIPSGCTKISWYHFSPFLRWDESNPGYNFSAWKDDWYHSTTNSTARGGMDRSEPYDWNWYDCDPTLNDTDHDLMDDNWDNFPLRFSTRNSTFAAINSVQPIGGTKVDATKPCNDVYYTNASGDYKWGYFGSNISILELEKGDLIDINVSVGLEQSNPDNVTHINYINGYWNPIRVVIRFRPIGLGPNGTPHDSDDINDTDNVARLTRTFTNVDAIHVMTDMQEKDFINHLGNNSTTITFFYQTFQIRVPSRVPAGHIAITVESQCDGNIHFFPSDPLIVY